MTRRQTIALLALIGLGIATYLAMYKLGYIGQLACSISSCEAVNTSRWSLFLGVPVAVWGAGFYLATFIVATVGNFGTLAASRGVALLLALMSGVGFVFSAYLTSTELFIIHAICVWCVVSACIVTIIFALSLADLKVMTRDADPVHPAAHHPTN